MTPDEKRIAIAEFCGWKLEQSNPEDGKCWHLNGVQSEEAPPLYLDDLNAMHEAWLKLDQKQRDEFRLQLLKITIHPTSMWLSGYHLDQYANAISSQRAAALLATIGNLKEDK